MKSHLFSSKIFFIEVVVFCIVAAKLLWGEPPTIGGYTVYYGSLHNHCDINGNHHALGTPDEAFNYAKNTSHLDFLGLTDHDLYISTTNWDAVKTAADKYNQDNVFVALRGFEWTTMYLGHIAILNTDDYCVSSSVNTFQSICSWINNRNSSVAFLNHPGRQNENGQEFGHFNIPAIPNIVGMELWNKTDPFSDYYYNDGYLSNDHNKGYFDEALNKGWKIGASGSEDNHQGTWGTAANSRLAVLSKQLSRDSLLAAFRSRRFYSTLDKNIVLSFKIDNEEMGSTITSGSSRIQVQAIDVDGESFNKVMIFNKNHDTIASWNINTTSIIISHDVTTTDSNYFYVKISQPDGDEAISSPIWVVPNQLPTCTITAPLNESQFVAPASITLRANAIDPDGSIDRVKFYVNGKYLNEDVHNPFEYEWSGMGPGLYNITAVAIDKRNSSKVSNQVSITVNAGPNAPVVVLKRIGGSSDDAEESQSGTVSLNSSDLEIVNDAEAGYGNQVVGLRFSGLGIPKASIINSAYIQFTTDEVTSGSCLVSVRGEASDNSATFTTASRNVSNRTRTRATISWNIPLWDSVNVAVLSQRTPDLKSIIQEIVNRSGYTSSSALSIIFTGSGTRTAKSFDGSTTDAPYIAVEYNRLPVCSITAPINNAVFTASTTVDVTVNASDPDGTISKVTFYVDGNPLGDDVSAPFSYGLTGLTTGAHILKAIAIDNSTAKDTSDAITINILPPNQLPVCAITSPVNNSSFTVPASVIITADASDPDGSISKASFYRDGIFLGEDVSAPYTYDVANIAAGIHELTAIATDNVSATTTSAAVSITVNAPNQLPVCAITSPLNNASFTVPASVTITADASDPDGSISKVSFYSDGILLGEDVSAPYTYDVASIAAGTHVLTAIATDNALATTTSAAISITVNAPNQLPVCAITSPLNNASLTVPASVTITAEASDPDGSISKVSFYSEGVLLGEDVSAPYTYDVASIASGTHVFTAIATDNVSATTTSAAVIITVNAANQLPVCAVTSPLNNALFTVPASVTITAEASDADGSISKVSFYSDGIFLGEDASAPYTYDVASIAAGIHVLTATATDNASATTISAAISITVNAPNQLPVCTITSPVNNSSFTVPVSLTITAEAADADGSISKVSFYNDGVLLGEDASAPYTYDVASIAAGNHVLTAITADNVSATTTSAAVNITVNAPNQLPACAITSPLNNASFTVPVSLTITAEASDPDGSISKVSFYSDGVLLGEDVSAPYTYDVASIAAGTHVFTAIATDNVSATTTSAAVNITVNAPNQLPACAITSPLNNAIFTAPVSVTITVEASDPDGIIQKVLFYEDEMLKGMDESAPYSWELSDQLTGQHLISAIAIDNKGDSSTICTTNITVQPPQAPVLLYPNNMDSTVSATSFLQWKKTVSLKAFQFQISDREDFADAKVDSIINDTLFSMSGKDFLPGRTKFWRVRARDGLNIGSWSDIWKFTILPEPRKVVLLNPERDTSYNVDSAVFVWSKMSLCDRYHFRLTSDSGMTDLIVDDSSLTDTVRVQKGLPINKTFWWSVKAHNQSGWGAFNPPRKFTISIPVTSVKEKCFVNFLNGLSNNQYKIDYGLSKTTHVTIRIFTAQGKLVRDVLSTTQKRGSYTLPITQSRLPKGCYILYFRTDEMLLTRMFIVSN